MTHFTTGIDSIVERIAGEWSTREGIEHIEYTMYDLTRADSGLPTVASGLGISPSSAWTVARYANVVPPVAVSNVAPRRRCFGLRIPGPDEEKRLPSG